MKKILNLKYSSSLTDFSKKNPSFDTAVLRVAYSGENRKATFISKESFEKAIPSMYNCPIVCNYSREDDTLGGHDVDVVRNKNGSLKMVNVTTPVGCIPESAKYWWEEVKESDGTKREYLHVEVLIWKRQEAYSKIKKDGISAHSMEIEVKDGRLIDGLFYVNEFIFTAFALIGVTPCFESSTLEFSMKGLKLKVEEMTRDLKESFNSITPSLEDDDKNPHTHLTRGGRFALEEKIKGLNKSDEKVLEENLDEGSDGLEKKDDKSNKFALNENILSELRHEVHNLEVVEYEGFENSRYWLTDYDLDKLELYVFDTLEDFKLYGFKFSLSGDSVQIDKDSKKRKKFIIADFEESEDYPLGTFFAKIGNTARQESIINAKYKEANKEIKALSNEVESLMDFKLKAELEAERVKKESIFEQFDDLANIAEFQEVKESYKEYSIEELEEKCFAIRGKNTPVKKASPGAKSQKIVFERTHSSKEPYGGLFTKYEN